MVLCRGHGPLPVLDMHEGRTLLTAGLTMAALLAVSAMRAMRRASVLGKTADTMGASVSAAKLCRCKDHGPSGNVLMLSTALSVSWR